MSIMKVDTEALGERIAVHVAHIEAAMHVLLSDLREFDQAGGWARQGAQSCAHWLSWRVGWNLGTAREHVRVANRLAELPRIDDALRRGEVSYSKVRAMTRVATTANEDVLLEEARLTTGQQLETICRKYAIVQRHGTEANPDDDKERRHVTRSDTSDGMVRIAAVLHPEEAAMVWAALERMVKEGHRGAKPRGRVEAGRVEGGDAHRDEPGDIDVPGLAGCEGRVPAGRSNEPPSAFRGPELSSELDDGGQLADREDVLEQGDVPAGMSNERPSGDGAGRTPGGGTLARARHAQATIQEQRFTRADALVAMAQEVLRGAHPERSPTELVVTIAAERLHTVRAGWAGRRLEHADDLSDVGCCADGTAVSVDAVRRLACDAGVVTMVEGNDGSPLSVGRKTRSIPGSMKRALLQRDRGCRFPGCSNRLFVEGHHVKHWADGGETKLSNLASLCSHHHRFVHEYGYRIELQDGELAFRDPRGRLVEPAPGPAGVSARGMEMIRHRNAPLAIDERTLACEWDGQRLNLVGCIDELVRADDRGRKRG